MRKLLQPLFIILAFVAVHPALAQHGTLAVPAQAEMEKYPILKSGEMTIARMADLELRPIVLTDTMTVFNWYAKDGRFVYETLSKGTLVYVDRDDVVHYKADCTNRLVKASDCPKCLEIIAALRADSITKANKTSASVASVQTTESKSWFAKAWGLSWIFQAILFLIALAIGLGILFLTLVVIGWLIREALRFFESLTHWTPTPLAPMPMTSAPAIVPPVPTPTPTIIVPNLHEIHIFYPDGTSIVMESRRQ